MSTALDVLGLGVATVDLVALVEHLPDRDDVQRAIALVTQGGGPVATALVTLARLGARVARLDSIGEDWRGKLIHEEFARENVFAGDWRAHRNCSSSFASGSISGKDQQIINGTIEVIPMSIKLAGVFPPIPTPFDSDGNLLLDKLKTNIALWNKTGLHGYVVLGSNGEAPMLTDTERFDVWQAARDAIPRDKLLLVGAGVESTRHCIALAKRAAEFGADAAMFVTPSYYKSQMTSANLVHHYRTIADAAPLPTIIYNMPAATGIDIDANTVIQLAEHPNIIGVKDSSGNVTKFEEIIRAVRPDFSVIAGSGGYFYPALCIGAQGTVAALANIAPRECVAIYDAFRAGQHDVARELQLRFVPLNAAVTTRWNVPGLKAALEELNQGFYGGPPRLPVRPLPDADRAALRKVMQQAGVI